MDVAVTGAYGHIGSNLVHRLVADGHDVRAVDVRRTGALEGLPVQHVHASVTDRASMSRALVGCELVYHLAAKISVVGDPDGSVWRTNVDGAVNTGHAAVGAGVRRMIHVSSVHALDYAHSPAPIDESTALATSRRAPVYDRSKATAELLLDDLAQRGLDLVTVRPTAVVGPGDHDISRMGRFIRGVGSGRWRVTVSGGFDWVDVRDVVDGIVAAAERGHRGSSYMLSGSYHSIRELSDLVAAVTGVKGPRITVPASLVSMIGRPATWWARRTADETVPTTEALRALRHGKPIDSSRARRELGYESRPLSETLRDFFVWLDEVAPSASR